MTLTMTVVDQAPTRTFSSKDQARLAVWEGLRLAKVACFPFPIFGRIPNFQGAREAAERLLALPLFAGARRIKVNPDAPQRFVREAALRRGIVVFTPTPRLKGGFKRLDPARIPEKSIRRAAALTTADEFAQAVPLAELPAMDVVVVGSVAVTRSGKRCGKGHGHADLEYAILRDLGHPAVPVVTTTHPLQILDDFPVDPHDLPVSVIATPDEIISVPDPPPAPDGIDWSLLTAKDLRAMPVLAEMKLLRSAAT